MWKQWPVCMSIVHHQPPCLLYMPSLPNPEPFSLTLQIIWKEKTSAFDDTKSIPYSLDDRDTWTACRSNLNRKQFKSVSIIERNLCCPCRIEN